MGMELIPFLGNEAYFWQSIRLLPESLLGSNPSIPIKGGDKMREDISLLYEVSKKQDGTNVHSIGQIIFIYRTAIANIHNSSQNIKLAHKCEDILHNFIETGKISSRQKIIQELSK